jgi:hypothetical protein
LLGGGGVLVPIPMTAKSVVFFTLKMLLKTGKLLTLLIQYYPSRPQLQRSINLKFPFFYH